MLGIWLIESTAEICTKSTVAVAQPATQPKCATMLDVRIESSSEAKIWDTSNANRVTWVRIPSVPPKHGRGSVMAAR